MATPSGLLRLYLFAGMIAAVLGIVPLASWLDTMGANQDIGALRDLSVGVADFGAGTGLDRPYKALHEAIKSAEAAKFFGAR